MYPSANKKSTKEEDKIDKKPIIMKYQYQGKTLASKFKDEVQWVTDTKIGHIEIEDIKIQLTPAPHTLEVEYRRIKRSGLVEATIFSQAM